MVGSKTEKRRQTIERGTRKGASLGERAQAREAVSEIRALSGEKESPNTALESYAQEAARETIAGEGDYKAPDPTRAESLIVEEEDSRHVPIRWLLEDLRKMTKRCARGYNKEERSDIATDALLLIAKWSSQGSEEDAIPLGEKGKLPLRAVWLDREKRAVVSLGKNRQTTRPAPNDRALRAMRAAVLQALRKRDSDAESALSKVAERVTDANGKTRWVYRAQESAESYDSDSESMRSSLAQEAKQRAEEESDKAPALPDSDAAELLADAMGVTLTAARSIIAQGWRLSVDDCARLWNVSAQRAKNIRAEGARELRRLYPETGELWRALKEAAPSMRALMALRAQDALTAYRNRLPWQDATALAQEAAQAVNEYRAAIGELPMHRRAIELAAARARWIPRGELTAADYLDRLLRAEEKRGKATAALAGYGSAPAFIDSDSAGIGAEKRRRLQLAFLRSESEPNRARAVCRWVDRVERILSGEALTRADRVWTYGLAARDDRQERSETALAQAAPITDGRGAQAAQAARQRQAQRDSAAIDRERAARQRQAQEAARQAAQRECHCALCEAATAPKRRRKSAPQERRRAALPMPTGAERQAAIARAQAAQAQREKERRRADRVRRQRNRARREGA